MRIGGVVLVVLLGCSASEDEPPGPDAGPDIDAEVALVPDAAGPDEPDAEPEPATLGGLRDRLFSTYVDSDACGNWVALDESQREVFLTLTDRLFKSTMPDGTPMLAHFERLYLILGGGSDGGDCGGGENNRLFLSMDAELWELMVAAWNEEMWIQDGGTDTFWARTNDIAGPHDPFDASSETQSGLRCILITELPDSQPPTGQSHFFLDGSATRVERGPGIDLDADPYMFEIDHDYDCFHQSNPTCGDFAERYRDHYGDYEPDWAPAGC